MCVSVLSVPPEAVNMSLGLSIAFAVNPFRLLVSCLGSWECSKGRSWGPKAARPGVLMGGDAGLKGQGADTLERAGGALGRGELWGAGGGNGNYHIQAPGGRCTQRTASGIVPDRSARVFLNRTL